MLYGCGLRLMERLHLRVKDIDFEQSQVVVREGKGEKDRLTMLPVSLIESLKAQIAFVQKQHTRDLANGYGSVELRQILIKSCCLTKFFDEVLGILCDYLIRLFASGNSER
jgi:integrase